MIACFLAATQLAARKQNKKEQGEAAKIHVSVSLGEPQDIDGFGLAVDIKAEGVDEQVLQAAHEVCDGLLRLEDKSKSVLSQFCPYSRALKHGISVKVSKA
jgi:organic hydroperoxide reductase OsmC/OhrA